MKESSYSVANSNINIELSNDTGAWAFPIKVGTKIEVRDFMYEELRNNKEITNKFNLNVKRLNRWYYSIYFAEKNNGGKL